MDSLSIGTQNSVSSINSLASLLKEKILNVPAYIRKRKEKTKEFKVKVGNFNFIRYFSSILVSPTILPPSIPSRPLLRSSSCLSYS